MRIRYKGPKLSIEKKKIYFSNTLISQKLALIISGIVIWGGIIGITFYKLPRPMISTGYYHANIQFRAGTESSYDDIFNQSLQYIVDMYYRHPNWVWTLECQGLLIEMAYERYPTIFYKIQEMNQRNQLEIISPQYSHALAVAYNYKDLAESIEFNKHLLEDIYNLTISNVLVFQEGQFLPAFPLLKSLGFDTILVSRDQLSYQNEFPSKPLLNYEFGGIQAYIMPVPWLPLFEAGAFHHHLVLSDSERVNTGGEGAIEGDYEFNFNPEKQRQLELRHIELEKMGNQFLTMSQWAKRCIEKGQIGKLSKFMPESHWTPTRHQSVSRWMAWDNGESDDGIVHARNYYTRNLLQAAEILLEKSKSYMSDIENTIYTSMLLEGKKHLWLAEVTDTSGVNPNENEFAYAINNTYQAQVYANSIIEACKEFIPDLQKQQIIQVNSLTRTIVSNVSEFSTWTSINKFNTLNYNNNNYTGNIGTNNLVNFNQLLNDWMKEQDANNENLSISLIPDLSIKYNHNDSYPFNISYETAIYSVKLGNLNKDFPLLKLTLEFTGPRYQYITNTQPIVGKFNNTAACEGVRSEQHMIWKGNWNDIIYSPSLAENYTIKIHRMDYHNPAMNDPDYYIVPLPISNGFVYNPKDNYAIITNNTVRHISVKWETDSLDFYEKETQYNSRYEFLVYVGDLESAHLLANLINPYPILEV